MAAKIMLTVENWEGWLKIGQLGGVIENRSVVRGD